MSAPAALRRARATDAPRLAELVRQLGHPYASEGMDERLPRLLADANTEIWVATQDDAAVGCAVLEFAEVFHRAGLSATLALLVVDQDYRSRGIGAQLVACVEARARERRAKRITLTSAKHREAAHRFYRRLGYESTGLRFARDLD